MRTGMDAIIWIARPVLVHGRDGGETTPVTPGGFPDSLAITLSLHDASGQPEDALYCWIQGRMPNDRPGWRTIRTWVFSGDELTPQRHTITGTHWIGATWRVAYECVGHNSARFVFSCFAKPVFSKSGTN
jgi:hypothetical protein